MSFVGPAELRAVLLTKKDAFVRCLSDKLLTYALGRGTERCDRCARNKLSPPPHGLVVPPSARSKPLLLQKFC